MRKQQRLAWHETTTYQLNLCGNPITTRELVTPLARLIGNQKQAITLKFPRMKLADDSIRFGPGQAIVTPSMIKGEFISEYQTDQNRGLARNTADFIQNLLVERDDTDPRRRLFSKAAISGVNGPPPSIAPHWRVGRGGWPQPFGPKGGSSPGKNRVGAAADSE